MIIIDARFLNIAKKIWGKRHEIVPSFTHPNLQNPVSAHPDMTLTQIEDIFVCCPESFEYYKKYLGNRVVAGKTTLSSHYPNDIAYNVLIYQNLAIAKEKYIDDTVKEQLQKKKIKLINVNQGYAKCSSSVCNSGVITADDTIFDALVKNNINALKITPGHVKLSGYTYGFIGGASGFIDGKNTFFGNLKKHPDFDKIKQFCEIDFFEEFPLTDVGTIFCI